MTELTAAALVAMVLSFVVFGTAAAWYAVPWMRTVALGAAITPLLWIHTFRYVALQLFSAQAFGFAIPDLTRDQIVYGDLIGMGLALATLYALRYRWRLAIPLAWAFVAATVLDLSNAAVMGIREPPAGRYLRCWRTADFGGRRSAAAEYGRSLASYRRGACSTGTRQVMPAYRQVICRNRGKEQRPTALSATWPKA
jgi:hypothetical protein